MKKIAATLAAVLALAACSDNREPSDKSFAAAIDHYAEEHGVCLPLSLDIQSPQGQNSRTFNTLGEPTIKIAERNAEGDKINAQALKLMRSLDKEGFYDRQDAETITLNDEEIKVQVYTLTEKGSDNTVPSPHGPLFCVGKETVKKVNWYTDPAPSEGVTMSRVSYEAEFKPESWAKKVLEHIDHEWKDNDAVRTKTATVVLTNKGWLDIRELH